MIKTGRVTDRRPLRFNSVDELLADAERIAASERAGTLRRTGNWTAGQTFNHLGAFMSYLYDGFPRPMQAPWFIRLLVRGKKNAYCFDRLPAGVHIPRIKGGTTAIEPVPLEVGLTRLRAAAARLKTTPPTVPSPIFGPMSHEEAVGINLRHAELHLSFLHPA